MTRVTLGELKNAARDRSRRRPAPGVEQPFSTPMPTAASAVRRLHRDGAEAAVAQLNAAFDRSSHWGPGGPSRARSWANSIRECFQSYAELVTGDSRPTLGMPVTTDVDVGEHTIGVSLDVILLDPNGYVGRYLLWDTPTLNQDDAELLAAPIVLALQRELGDDRVAGVEIWHLRSRRQTLVHAAAALARVGEVATIVDDYTS